MHWHFAVGRPAEHARRRALNRELRAAERCRLEHAPPDFVIEVETHAGRRSVTCDGRWFVTAGQDRIMQIRRVGFSGIKGYDYLLTPCIYPDVAHSRDARERFAQFADAFIAIFSFRRDRDSLQHRFIRAV